MLQGSTGTDLHGKAAEVVSDAAAAAYSQQPDEKGVLQPNFTITVQLQCTI